jgi:hypothetical protein
LGVIASDSEAISNHKSCLRGIASPAPAQRLPFGFAMTLGIRKLKSSEHYW